MIDLIWINDSSFIYLQKFDLLWLKINDGLLIYCILIFNSFYRSKYDI